MALSSALCVIPGRADPAVTLAVDCPILDAEARSALEARSRTELIVRNASGTFVVVCRDDTASLTWHPLDGDPTSGTAQTSADSRASIDRILEALDALLTPPPATAAAGEATPVPPVMPAAAAAPNVVISPPPVLVLPPQAAAGAPATNWSVFRGVLFGAGAAAELWSNTATLGPRARVALALPARFAAGISGTALFSLRSPQDVSGRLVRIALGGDYGIDDGERFRAGLDAFVDLVHAGSSSAGSSDKTAFGFELRASAAVVTNPVRVELGPTLAVHPSAVQAKLGPNADGSGSGSTTPFEVHAFTVGLVLDVVAGPVL